MKTWKPFQRSAPRWCSSLPTPSHIIRLLPSKKKLACELLSDPGNTVAARFGLKYTMAADLKALYQQFGIDLEDYNGDASWTLPLPARMIIDTDGIVRYAAINADYTVRPDPAETIAALKTII